MSKATERNWNKGRLIGFCLNTSTLTNPERLLYQEILNIKDELVKGWDKQTEVFTGNPIARPYKCWCGKRSKIARLSQKYPDQYLCLTHYKEEQNGNT